MESYIEISFIIQSLYMLIACMTAGYLSLKPISLKQSFVYSLTVALCACILWGTNSWLIMVIVEFLFFLLIFRYCWKTYILMITIRCLISWTCYAIYRGGFHNFQYFLPMVSPIAIILVELFVLYLLYRKWNYWIGKLNYVYDCHIKNIPMKKPIKGYLDTGNLLTIDDVPVVFMDEKFQTYFKDLDIQYLVMNTMSGSAPIACYKSIIDIHGLSKKDVYIHCKKQIQLPMQCQILLNINLWLG